MLYITEEINVGSNPELDWDKAYVTYKFKAPNTIAAWEVFFDEVSIRLHESYTVDKSLLPKEARLYSTVNLEHLQYKIRLVPHFHSTLKTDETTYDRYKTTKYG